MFINPTREVTIQDMMYCREQRVRHQRQLLETYHVPLISFTLNIPGPIKSSNELTYAFQEGKKSIDALLSKQHYSVLDAIELHNVTGDELIYAVDADANQLKDCSIQIEELHPLGRLFDIDIIQADGTKLSRPKYRTCLLCNKQVQDCARNRTHTIEELQSNILTLIKLHM